MNRRLFSLRAVAHIRYVPRIIWLVKNWPFFLLNYAGIWHTVETYYFRDGLIIKTKSLVDVTTIAIVFIKQEYGDIPSGKKVVVDIGSNIGSFALYAVRSGAEEVFSYEPEEQNFEVLSENIKMNHFEKRIHAFNTGVGGSAGMRRLYLSESPYHSLYQESESKKFVEISCVTLEGIFGANAIEHIDLLKLDCEGAEFEILLNTPGEYLRRIGEIRMEYHNRNGNKVDDLRAFLERNGFRVILSGYEADTSGIMWFAR